MESKQKENMGSIWGSIDEKVNNLSLSIGLSSLFLWIYFNISLGSWRHEVHPNPLAILGVLFLPISLLSYFDLINKRKRRWVKNSIMVCEIVLLILIFGMSVLALTIKGDGHDLPGKAYKDYDDVSFSPNWFPRYVFPRYVITTGDWRYWSKVVYKFIRPKVCEDYLHKYGNLNASKIHRINLTPLEAGCCRPPKQCDVDVPRKKAKSTINIDEESEGDRRMRHIFRVGVAYNSCPHWFPESNLCVHCPKCKNAFLVTVKMEWRSMAITNLSILLLLTTAYLINTFYVLQNQIPMQRSKPYFLPK